MIVRSYRELVAWQKAMDLVERCYKVTAGFPTSEVYGLSNQLRRAAVSVPANIAEGQGRRHTREFLHHLSIAYGSLAEVETHIAIARRLDYLTSDVEDALLLQSAEVGRLINGLRRSLSTSNGRASTIGG